MLGSVAVPLGSLLVQFLVHILRWAWCPECVVWVVLPQCLHSLASLLLFCLAIGTLPGCRGVLVPLWSCCSTLLMVALKVGFMVVGQLLLVWALSQARAMAAAALPQ